MGIRYGTHITWDLKSFLGGSYLIPVSWLGLWCLRAAGANHGQTCTYSRITSPQVWLLILETEVNPYVFSHVATYDIILSKSIEHWQQLTLALLVPVTPTFAQPALYDAVLFPTLIHVNFPKKLQFHHIWSPGWGLPSCSSFCMACLVCGTGVKIHLNCLCWAKRM